MSKVTCPDCLAGVSHSWSSDETKYVHAPSNAERKFTGVYWPEEVPAQTYHTKWGIPKRTKNLNIKN